jgi:hypothetical protein
MIARDYTDSGISGAATSRPALDELLRDAKRRKFCTPPQGTVLQEAVIPTVPSKAYGILPIPSGVGLGFAIGAGGVWARRRFIRP